jgi:hypothetical protein
MNLPLALVTLLVVFIVSCKEKSVKILHLEFIDDFGSTYNIMDSGKKEPLSDVAIYFLIAEQDPKQINIKDVENFIKNDSFVQNQIHKNYYRLTAIFLHKSKYTDDLLKFRSQKALTLCDNNIFLEHLWLNGEPSDTLYYKNAIIEGTEKINLLDVKN